MQACKCTAVHVRADAGAEERDLDLNGLAGSAPEVYLSTHLAPSSLDLKTVLAGLFSLSKHLGSL